MTTSTPEAPVADQPYSNPTGGALAIRADQQQFDDKQLAALRQLGVEQAPPGDLAVFLHYAQRTGLDPFARQIYMIARRSRGEVRWTIQVGIDAFRIVAQRSHEYAGQVGPEWCGPDGTWRDVWLDNQPPAAARVGVLRKGFTGPLYAVALWREYVPTDRDGKPTGLWPTKPALMLAKVAEALALRKAFPHDLSGIYTGDELAKGDGPAVAAGGTPMDQLRQQVANDQQQAADVDPERLAELRASILLATEVEGTDDLLRDLHSEAKGLGALAAQVDVPDGWRGEAVPAPDGTPTPDQLPVVALIMLARKAHQDGVPHGEQLAAAEAEQLCDAVRKKDGAHCGLLQDHPGRHDYLAPAPEQSAVEGYQPCGEQDAQGWHCQKPEGHDGDHDGVNTP